ncbi:MAG: hypothetical protein AAB573_00415 [Patescibacteria group bacterium]
MVEPRRFRFKSGPVSPLELQREALHTRIAELRAKAKRAGPQFAAALTSCSNLIWEEKGRKALNARARMLDSIEVKIENVLKHS